MHLAGQGDAAQAGKRQRLGAADGGDHVQRGLPPVFGMLFRPAGMGSRYAQGHAAAGEDGLRVIGEDGLDFGSADIDAEIGHDGSMKSGWAAACGGDVTLWYWPGAAGSGLFRILFPVLPVRAGQARHPS